MNQFDVNPQLVHEQATTPSVGIVCGYDGNGPLELVWVGRLVASKAINLALEAIHKTGESKRIRLHIIGDGPEREMAEALAEKYNLGETCVWHGWLDSEKMKKIMYESHAFLFTSLLEATSTSVTESLSCGLPVLCLNHCGFGDITDDSCAIKVDVGTKSRVVAGFSDAICLLLSNPDLVEELSRGACKKAEQFSWDDLAGKINEVYFSVIK